MRRNILDANRSLPLIITEEDVKRAKKCDPNFCVIANAMFGTYPDIENVHVGPSFTKVVRATTITRHMTPPIIKRAIAHFDRTGEWGLPPGTYTLGAVPKSQRLGARSLRANSWVVESKGKGKLAIQSEGGTRRVMFTGTKRSLTARRITRVETYAKAPKK